MSTDFAKASETRPEAGGGPTPSSAGLSRFLEDAKSEGHFDSSGAFSVDLKQAQGKLQNHLLQLEDTLLYILQSAVASRATRFEVTSTVDRIEVVHDGFFPTPEESLQLPQWALLHPENAEQAARHRLGLALASSLSPAGRGMELFFPDSRGLHLSSGGLQSINRQADGRHRIGIPLTRSWWRRHFPSNGHPAVKNLAERGSFAPLRLSIDGCPQGRTEWGVPSKVEWFWENGEKCAATLVVDLGGQAVRSGHHLLEVRWAADGEQSALGIPQASQASFAVGRLPSGPAAKMPQRCSAAAAIRVEGSPRLEIVMYGVNLQHQIEPPQDPGSAIGLPHLLFLLADDRTPTDLSFLKARPDQGWDERLSRLTEDLKEVRGASGTCYHTNQLDWMRSLLGMRSGKSKSARVALGLLIHNHHRSQKRS